MDSWRLRPLIEEEAVERMLQVVRNCRKESVSIGDSRPEQEAIRYLENHREDMRYQAKRGLGFPIGSGNVEAACKSLIAERLNRPGSHWKTHSGGHNVDLRAFLLSDPPSSRPRHSRSSRHHVTATDSGATALCCVG